MDPEAGDHSNTTWGAPVRLQNWLEHPITRCLVRSDRACKCLLVGKVERLCGVHCHCGPESMGWNSIRSDGHWQVAKIIQDCASDGRRQIRSQVDDHHSS